MKNRIIISGLVLVCVLAALGLKHYDRIKRAYFVSTLFTGVEQHDKFYRVDKLFPSTRMAASNSPTIFKQGSLTKLPAKFEFLGKEKDVSTFLTKTDTAALLVLKNGEIVFEDYWLTGGKEVNWLSMSVAKSFVSALIGIAVSEGHIESVDDLITNYVPELMDSAYEDVPIKDVLQMSSGASWNEDYSDKNSDINRFGQTFALGGSMNEFVATLVRENEPGSFNRYNSADTQALGMLLVNSTGRSITEYMNEKLWQPLGAEYPGYWITDDSGMEMAFGGLSLTARDYAKIGELYRLDGNWNGKQLVPSDWIKASLSTDDPHLKPGENNPLSDFELGYGYQWWIPESEVGEFLAIGVYNQFVYVHPQTGVVIVKLSANRNYGTSHEEEVNAEIMSIELFREIVKLVKTEG